MEPKEWYINGIKIQYLQHVKIQFKEITCVGLNMFYSEEKGWTWQMC